MMAAKGSIKVILEGRGALTLRESDYVATGGEGSIYRSGSTVVKLYSDLAKMRRDGMPDKIRALSVLKHPGIVGPQGMVMDDQHRPAGFYMPFACGEPMSRVFVSDFRLRTGFGDTDAVNLAKAMHEIVAHAHAQKALMVDANELNWLVDYVKGKPPAAIVIDVDSWAIGPWPATVIMPSIRDWSAKSFSEITDWYAWGIVAFQVFTGIHPFKGKLDGYKPGDLVQRMKDSASVFAPGARLPQSVRDFSCIPAPLLDWFQATFQQGARSVPPSPTMTAQPARAARTARAVIRSSGSLSFNKLFERAGDPAVRVWPNGIVRLASGEMCDLSTGKTVCKVQDHDVEIIRKLDGWVVTHSHRGEQVFVHIAGDGKATDVSFGLAMQSVFRAGERLFAVTARGMIEVMVRTLGKPVVTTGPATSLQVNSTRWFDDVAVQDVLGSAFVVLPLAAGGIVQVRVPGLDGANVVAGKVAGHFAAFTVLEKTGDYRKVELTFSKDFASFSTWTGPTDSGELNMAILPRGVVATIVDDGELTIFVPSNGDLRKFKDREITTEMKLTAWGESVVYLHDGAVWQLRVTP